MSDHALVLKVFSFCLMKTALDSTSQPLNQLVSGSLDLRNQSPCEPTTISLEYSTVTIKSIASILLTSFDHLASDKNLNVKKRPA